MAEITAKLVNELRSRTGQGLMECKKVLTEVGGDIEKGVERFRTMGVKTSVLERAAGEGQVFAFGSADGQTGALIEVNCNTDFTAKSTPVQRIAEIASGVL